MATISLQELARAERALQSVRADWLGRPGVTAVDLGYKWTGGQMTGRLSIRVHVAQKKDPAELPPGQLFPPQVKGVPVDVIEASYAPQTRVMARQETAVEGRGRRFAGPVPLGVSIGSRYTTAGTLGAKVIDRASGAAMILSNWHVLAGRRDAPAGLPIWQPGWIDGGTREENTIARLSRWQLGPVDAAVAELSGEREVDSQTMEGQPIEAAGEPHLGMLVWKSGRSSGYTLGLIDGLRMTVPMTYQGAGTVSLAECFRVVPRPGAGAIEISMGGDSGAVWVDEASGRAVGLHVAGEIGASPEYALAHNINVVLEALAVRLPADAPPAGNGNGQQPGRASWWAPLGALLRRYLGARAYLAGGRADVCDAAANGHKVRPG
ncbi:MAG: hypothetical protein ACRDHL_13425 [Candidatus Promineifilaceae bacterium]